MALQNGLDAAIINPNADAMMRSFFAYRALYAKDDNCTDYIDHYAGVTEVKQPKSTENMPLSSAIEHGLREVAFGAAAELLKTREPLAVINEELVPALDRVGKGFESGRVFLPQLLMLSLIHIFVIILRSESKESSSILGNFSDKSSAMMPKRAPKSKRASSVGSPVRFSPEIEASLQSTMP